MSASLRALLEGVIDYAGLFPPAQLPLEQAFSSYRHYRDDPESWMLGRFVIPGKRLSEVGPLLADAPAAAPLHFSVLLQQLSAQDLHAVTLFENRHGRVARVDSFELKPTAPEALPIGLPPGSLAGKPQDWRVFIELDAAPDWRSSTSTLLARIAHASNPVHGVKLRCGGLEAAAFPTPEQVAFVITACRDALVPLKFTAGLHHPIRHYNDNVKTKMHGFLNVFGAGVLAHRHHLNEEQVRRILEDEDPASFRFDDGCFRWKDCAATVGEIRLARQLAVTSFGSCSFDEPREDLRGLGLL